MRLMNKAQTSKTTRTRREGERGIALLMVITVLVTLAIVAVTFAPQMQRGRERTESNAAKQRAEFEVRMVLDHVVQYLAKSHPHSEQQIGGLDGLTGLGTLGDWKVDTLAEILPGEAFYKELQGLMRTAWTSDPVLVQRLKNLKDRGLDPTRDDRGMISSVKVDDAQARINVHGGQPFLLANLMGSALLTEDLDAGSSEIGVKNVSSSAAAGLPTFPAQNGWLRIGSEVIKYKTFDGQSFKDCERGVARETPLADNGGAQNHKGGTPVIDYTAYKIATHLISRKAGRLTRFTNVEDLRSVLGWGEGGYLPASRLAQIRDYVTLVSERETAEGWLAPQVSVQELPTSAGGDTPDRVVVRDAQNDTGTTSYVNPGTIVRVTDGRNTAYQVVAEIGDGNNGQIDKEFTLAGAVGADRPEDSRALVFPGGETMVAALAPYPININTASREVLFAVLCNLQHRLAKEDDQMVSPKLAWNLAEEIVSSRKGSFQAVAGTEGSRQQRRSGPFRNAEDWGRFLKDKLATGAITRAQEFALYTNAINPHSRDLKFGTAPWCFRTLDVYHVEARVAINNRAGEQIADAALRQVVSIGSDAHTTWTVDSQADFEERIQQGSGGKFIATYPFKSTFINNGTHHIQPRLRAPQHIITGVYPSSSVTANEEGDAQDVGDVRLEPVRMRLPGAVVSEHFDTRTYQDGHFTGYDGAYTRKLNGAFRSNGSARVQPFTMSFWWRPFSDSDSWTAFDCGMERFMNRFAIFAASGEQGPELVFRVCAGTMEQRGAEIAVPFERLDYVAGTWYHIHVSCFGEDPSTMQLLVDGTDIGIRRGVTVVDGSLDASGTEVPVKSTAGFPPFGAIQVGSEIIEYESLADGAFRDCVRGTRGTQAQEWNGDTPVRILGYTMPLLTDVAGGGAHLTEELGRWTALRVTGEGFDDTMEVELEDFPTPITVGGFNGANDSPQNFIVAPMWDQDQATALQGFNTKGYALLGCPEIGNQVDPGSSQSDPGNTSGGESVGGWEVVYYERDGEQFTIERYQQTKFQNAADPYFLATTIVTIQQDWPCFLVPISIYAEGGSDLEAYLDPSNATDLEVLRRYLDTSNAYDNDESARVVIGSNSEPEGATECIRYDSIDRNKAGPGILFVRDRNIGSTTRHFFGRSSNINMQQQGQDPTDNPDDVPDDVPDDTPDDDTPPGPGDIDDPPPPSDTPDDTPETPAPGGGVPPGLRDPSDPEPDPGDDTGPGDAPDDPSDPGTEDPDDSEPGADGTIEPGDPLDEEDDPDSGTGDPDGGPGEEDLSGGDDSSGGGDSGGSGSEGGENGGSGTPPSEIEPPVDGSGSGDEEGADESLEGPGGRVPPDAREPADPDQSGDVVGTNDFGGTWNPDLEPVGPENARNRLRFRGVNGTVDLEHLAPGGSGDENSRFLPCFKAWEGATGALSRRTGRNDQITFSWGGSGSEGAPPSRQEMRVRWGDVNSNWMALTDFTNQRIPAAERGAKSARYDWRDYARILKFPCGELPDEMPDEMEFGRSTISNSDVVTAFLDELHIWRHSLGPIGFISDVEGVDGSATSLTVVPKGPAVSFEDVAGFDEKCGIFLVDGEMIVYRDTADEGNGAIQLDRAARGMFGTKAAYHPLGSYGVFVPGIPVSYLEGSLSADASTVGLATTDGWPREGLVRIVSEEQGELLHYTKRTETELIMPEATSGDEDERGRGLLRGRFGTEVSDHDNSAVVIFTPFRYWDRYTPRRNEDNETFSGVYDHADSSYFELGLRARDGWWHTVRWEENLDGSVRGSQTARRDDGGGSNSGFLDVVVMGRLNTNVPWDSKHVVDLRKDNSFGSSSSTQVERDKLFVLDDPEEANRISVEAGSAQFRIYFVYKPNAYEFVDLPGGGGAELDEPVLVNHWKKSPWLSSFSVGYTNRTRHIRSTPIGYGR